MNDELFFYKVVPEKELQLSQNETAARLSAVRGYTNDTVLQSEKALRKVLESKYTALRTKVSLSCENCVDLGFGAIESKALYRNLEGCSSAFVFSATLGYGVDRLLQRLSVTSVSEYFIADALASSFAEALCAYAAKELRKGIICRPRFSPGYADLTLEIQKELLKMTNAEKLLGITLSQTLLMSPVKSVTAIMGIADNPSVSLSGSCPEVAGKSNL